MRNVERAARQAAKLFQQRLWREIDRVAKGMARDIFAKAKAVAASWAAQAERAMVTRGRAMRPSEIERQFRAAADNLLREVSASASERAYRQRAAFETIVSQLSSDETSKIYASLAFESQRARAMMETELGKRARPVFGLHFEMDSPFGEWESARELLRKGMTDRGARYIANQAKAFLIDWYARYYASVINLFYTVYWKHVNPRSGVAIRSHRFSRALGVQFSSLNDMDIGLFGDNYLRWIAYKLEDGGYIHLRRAKALTVPNYRKVPKVHAPPWRRARLHRDAVLVWFRYPSGTLLGFIAVPKMVKRPKSTRDKFEEPLFWLKSQVYIRPKRFWSRTVAEFERRFGSLLPRIDAMTVQQWERFGKANRRRVTLLIRDLGDYAKTTARLTRLPKARTLFAIGPETPNKPFFQVNARYERVIGLVSPEELKPILRRLAR